MSVVMPPIRPMLAILYRQRLMPLLVIIQIALAYAILANTLYLLQRQLAPMLVDDGIARGQLLIATNMVSSHGQWNGAQVQAGAQALRAMPGVRDVAPVFGAPMNASVRIDLNLKSPAGVELMATGFGGENQVQTFGLDITQGRDFNDADYFSLDMSKDDGGKPQTTPIILTEVLAKRLFPDGHALGGVLNGMGDNSEDRYVVVGLVRHLLRYELKDVDDGKAEYSVLMPSRIDSTPILTYAVRTDPAQRDAVLKAMPDMLKRQFGADLIHGVEPQVSRYEDLRASAFKSRRAAVWLLGTVSAVVTLITLVGIASLSGYWIAQRTRQIGIRRALGATSGQILGYFQTENFLITAIGLLLGLPLAYAVNQWLMQHYELPRLPWQYLPLGALVLWLLGQLSVLWPAKRAADVPPAIATRSA